MFAVLKNDEHWPVQWVFFSWEEAEDWVKQMEYPSAYTIAEERPEP